MRTLIQKLLILGLPFVVGISVVSARLRTSPTNIYFAKREGLKSIARDVEILVTGSSEANSGIVPKEFGRPAYNLAAPSQTLYYDVGLLHRYIPVLPKLRLVLVPLSYFSLETQLDQGPEYWRCYYYRFFHGISHRDAQMARHIRNFNSFFLLGAPRTAAVLINADKENVARQYDRWGGVVDPATLGIPSPLITVSTLRASAEEAVARHTAGMRLDNLRSNLDALNQMHLLLMNRGIRLVLVTLPVSEPYRIQMSPEIVRRDQDALTGWTKNTGILHFNFRADPRFNLDSDFTDGDHLTLRGAEKLSRILKAEVIDPLIGVQ